MEAPGTRHRLKRPQHFPRQVLVELLSGLPPLWIVADAREQLRSRGIERSAPARSSVSDRKSPWPSGPSISGSDVLCNERVDLWRMRDRPHVASSRKYVQARPRKRPVQEGDDPLSGHG
jgi:hypothetical protein